MSIQAGRANFRHTGELPPVKRERYPQRLIVFDTEAYRSTPVDGVELQTLRLGVASFVELDPTLEVVTQDHYNFTTPEGLGEFIEWHTRKDKSLFVYAHNLRYDLQLSGVYTWLVDHGWTTTLFVIESPPTFIKLKRGRMSITFVDTFNYWQFSLEAMGEQLGLPKLKVDFTKVGDGELLEYCQRDVDLLTQYLLSFMRFLRDNDLCGLGLTLASQAFRSFRYRFLTGEVILHDDAKATQLERDGYYGGRVEAFHIGDPDDDPYYKLDVNSMYPYVMKAETYPVELVAYVENIPLGLLKAHLDDYYCLAEVDLECQAPAYAYTNGTKLLFPVGEFRAVLHHIDLVRAVSRGEVVRVLRCSIYRRGEVFSKYVDYFYALKLKAEAGGDPITRHLAKIMLNSLYGKFGQRQIVSKIIPNTGDPKYLRLSGYSESLGHNVEVNYLGDTIEIRYKAGESYYSFPALAGAVTAYARSYLWGLILQAGKSNVYYVDTDSLIVNAQGYDRLTSYLDLKRLGYLKLEGLSDKLVIHGAKDYVFGGDIKLKGVPKAARKLSDNLWEYEQFRGAKTWMRDGMTSGVEIYTRQKTRKGIYDKGLIFADGSVSPLTLRSGYNR